MFLRYGMTENCGTCAHTIKDDPTCGGTIGPPQPVNEVKLVDVPEMNYTSEDKPNPRGEVCVRGMNCFIGYYKGTYLNLRATTYLHGNRREEHPGYFEGWVATHR
jgi:long-subunit acyl-CoA synthetase (AMP-forming)